MSYVRVTLLQSSEGVAAALKDFKGGDREKLMLVTGAVSMDIVQTGSHEGMVIAHYKNQGDAKKAWEMEGGMREYWVKNGGVGAYVFEGPVKWSDKE